MINEIMNNEIENFHTDLIKQGLIESDINEQLTKYSQSLLDKYSESFLERLIENGKTSIREHKYEDDEFKCRLELRWYKAFDLLEILIGSSLEIIQDIHDEETDDNISMFKILKRLHARSIRVAKEVLILMRNGYADGALARWRSLFEICATVLFIDKYGKRVAKMYEEYQSIETYNEMIEYQKRCEGLNFKPINDKDIYSISTKKDELESKYSKRYCQTYGWTCEVFLAGQLSFARIVEDIGFELWKPYYKMSCNSVHAGPKSLFYNIGLADRQDILLVGPTNIGFVDPAQLTSISLTQITTVLIKYASNYERLLVNNVLNILTTRLTDEFIRIQNEINEEEKKKNA